MLPKEPLRRSAGYSQTQFLHFVLLILLFLILLFLLDPYILLDPYPANHSTLTLLLFIPPGCSYRQRFRMNFLHAPTLQPQHAMTAACKGQIMRSNEGG